MVGMKIPGVVYMPAADIQYYRDKGVFTDQTLIGAFREVFARGGDRIALSGPRELTTFAELDAATDRGAAALWRLGLRPTDRALFQMRNCKELVYPGVHSDVGGSYSEKESGLSKITLEWMLAEAVTAGLLVDTARAATVLGKAPGNTFAPPDAAAQIHNSLQGVWWLLEFLPHRYYDRTSNRTRWRIPLGARRQIPDHFADPPKRD